jgi:hypothetical protein
VPCQQGRRAPDDVCLHQLLRHGDNLCGEGRSAIASVAGLPVPAGALGRGMPTVDEGAKAGEPA